MSLRRTLIFGCFSIALIALATYRYYPPQRAAPTSLLLQPTASVNIANHPFQTAIASTVQQQAKGLAGITFLKPDQAMYFPIDKENDVAFWMKGMIIPIDILWIREHKVAGITANILPPLPNTPDEQLIRYNSPVDQLDGVLEIAAHRAAQLNIQPGDPVVLPATQ